VFDSNVESFRRIRFDSTQKISGPKLIRVTTGVADLGLARCLISLSERHQHSDWRWGG